jgi:hypothetical protein
VIHGASYGTPNDPASAKALTGAVSVLTNLDLDVHAGR